MNNYLFLLSKDLENNLILSLFQSNFVTLFILSLFLFIFLFGEKLVFLFEKTWNNLYDRIYDPADSNDPFSDFVSLDQNVVQVITDTKIKFEDVAGNEEAKEELKEVVKFLKEPETFSKLGAGVPKGVLLGGPPGTGKTLLARAIAGEAGCNFIFCSGSDFDEMFVGVGAKRIRSLFKEARKHSPCIIFIDEIDSLIGGSRRGGMEHSSSRATINQILAEMDGFEKNENIIVIGATNH